MKDIYFILNEFKDIYQEKMQCCLFINSPLRWGVYIVIASFIIILFIIILHKVANAYNSESKNCKYLKFQSHIDSAKFFQFTKFHDKIS